MRINRHHKPVRAVRLVLVLVVLLFSLWGSPRALFRATHPAKAARQTNMFLPLALNGNIFEDASPSPPLPSYDGWLSYLNYYRTLSGLLPVSENKSWAEGSWNHSRYMVKNDQVGHEEDPNNAWYTPEGDLAARSSNLVASSDLVATDTYAIDSWMQAPFHALYILNPTLTQVGYASFREGDGGLQMGATLDVIRGIGELSSAVEYPIFFPGDGATVPIGSHWGEYPDPLASCDGYSGSAGLPLILQLGTGDLIPDVSGHSLKQGGTKLESCAFDETNYRNSDPDAQELGRGILAGRDAIVIVPRRPLEPGASYTVSVTVNGVNYTWSFKVAAQTQMTALSDSLSVDFYFPEMGLLGDPVP
jgi:hypothetical protein